MNTVYCPRCGAPILIEVEQATVRSSGTRLHVTWVNSEVAHGCRPDPTKDRTR